MLTGRRELVHWPKSAIGDVQRTAEAARSKKANATGHSAIGGYANWPGADSVNEKYRQLFSGSELPGNTFTPEVFRVKFTTTSAIHLSTSRCATVSRSIFS